MNMTVNDGHQDFDQTLQEDRKYYFKLLPTRSRLLETEYALELIARLHFKTATVEEQDLACVDFRGLQTF